MTLTQRPPTKTIWSLVVGVLMACSMIVIRFSNLRSAISLVSVVNKNNEHTSYNSIRDNPTYTHTHALLETWNSQTSVLATDLSKTLTSYLPSRQRPFVFFHMRKGGGSSIRAILGHSMKLRNPKQDVWIPCISQKCVPFSLPPPSLHASLYAGHVNYAYMAQLVRELGIHSSSTTTKSFHVDADVDVDVNDTDSDTPDDVDVIVYQGVENDRANPFGGCLTNIRPTVSRVESCWNARMTHSRKWKVPTSSLMTPEEWSVLLPDAVDQYGNGCNNEMARILGDTQNEKVVNQLFSPPEETDNYGTQDRSSSNSNHYDIDYDSGAYAYERQQLDTVLGRMAKCVIVRVDRCADSNTILRHFLPWIEGDLCTTHKNRAAVKASDKVDAAANNTKAKEAILSQNRFDELVFSFGAKLFDAQLAVAAEGEVEVEVEVDV